MVWNDQVPIIGCTAVDCPGRARRIHRSDISPSMWRLQMANERESDLLLDNVSTRRDPASTSVRHKVISRCLLEAYCQACRILTRSKSLRSTEIRFQKIMMLLSECVVMSSIVCSCVVSSKCRRLARFKQTKRLRCKSLSPCRFQLSSRRMGSGAQRARQVDYRRVHSCGRLLYLSLPGFPLGLPLPFTLLVFCESCRVGLFLSDHCFSGSPLPAKA